MNEEQERNQQEEHWRELAELLGIGSDAPSSKPVAKAPPPKEAKAPPPLAERQPEPVAMPVAARAEEPLPGSFADEIATEEPPLPDDAAAEEPDRDWKDADDRPRRGKRRRGRRGRREEPTPARIAEDSSDLEDADEEPLLPEDSDDGSQETEDIAEPVEGQTEEDLDVDNTLRDWNVPSWNELIASLYRPDR